MASNKFALVEHEADFCVVGGGLAGLCAAVAAARHGAKVVLMQERPMLGGNASSEIRMWVSGAHGKNNRETGIIEELSLENHYRNPDKNYSLWDGVMYELAAYTPGITLLLNCTCDDCRMEGNRVVSVSGWQMTTQRRHTVRAKLFADCSGDSVLAPLTGAQYRVGREARGEYGESIAPETADSKTMGMSCLMQAREEDRPSTFIPPKWAYHYTKADLPHRVPNMQAMGENFWYIEMGGAQDSIGDTETCRDELLKIAYGIWDYVKNDPENREKNQYWRLDWLGMLPGKRESRRYIGDHVMTQDELRAGGHFEDVIAFGGWSMDNHEPEGFLTPLPPTTYHAAPSPYGIPYRCLYSKNIENLLFAGRNISVTHVVCSSARVMATCALLGQAAGTAAAIAIRRGLTPRDVYESALEELRQTLMDDDCFLPYATREIPALTRRAHLVCSAENAEALRNGIDRPVGDADNGARLALGQAVEYRFAEESVVSRVRLVFDSDLNDETMPEYERKLKRNMICNRPRNLPDTYVPKTMTRAYRIEGITAEGIVPLVEETENYQRLRTHAVQARLLGVRFVPLATWGAEDCHLFAFDAR